MIRLKNKSVQIIIGIKKQGLTNFTYIILAFSEEITVQTL
jgi:hypothetical protein